MRYVIIGAGAIGGVLGARLAQFSSDHPPVLVARGEHGAAIASRGLRLRTYQEDVTLAVATVSGPDELQLRADDILVLSTKTQQTQAALDQWVDAPVFDDDGAQIGTAGELLPVLIATNGVESERVALRLFARVYGVCVWLPAVRLDPGEVILRIGPRSGAFIIGRYGASQDDADRALLTTIKTDWQLGTFTIHLVDDVMRWKYNKLLSNLANAPQALVADGDISAIDARLREEAERIYVAAGISAASSSEEEEWRGDLFTIRKVPGTPEKLGGSSWQSLARGAGSIESDYLNGEIVLLARSVGLEAPLNAAVQRLARQASRFGAGVGSMTIEELEAALG